MTKDQRAEQDSRDAEYRAQVAKAEYDRLITIAEAREKRQDELLDRLAFDVSQMARSLKGRHK